MPGLGCLAQPPIFFRISEIFELTKFFSNLRRLWAHPRQNFWQFTSNWAYVRLLSFQHLWWKYFSSNLCVLADFLVSLNFFTSKNLLVVYFMQQLLQIDIVRRVKSKHKINLSLKLVSSYLFEICEFYDSCKMIKCYEYFCYFSMAIEKFSKFFTNQNHEKVFSSVG